MKKLVAAFLALAPFVAFADGGLTFLKISGSPGSFYATQLKIGDLKNVLGKGLDLPIFSFAGLSGSKTLPVIGIGVGYEWKVAQNLTLTFGPAVAISGGKPVDIGVLVGLVWKF